MPQNSCLTGSGASFILPISLVFSETCILSASLLKTYLFFLRLHIFNGAVVTATLIVGICGELNTGLHSQTKANARNVTDLQEVINFHEMPCVLTVIA